MDPVLIAAGCSLLALLIVAMAAVLVVRCALSGTESHDRAGILEAVAKVVRALRGRR